MFRKILYPVLCACLFLFFGSIILLSFVENLSLIHIAGVTIFGALVGLFIAYRMEKFKPSLQREDKLVYKFLLVGVIITTVAMLLMAMTCKDDCANKAVIGTWGGF